MKSLMAMWYMDAAVRSTGGACARAVGGLANDAGRDHSASGRRGDVVVEAEPRDLREAAVGRRHQRDAVLQERLELGAVDVDGRDQVSERKHAQHLPPGDREGRRRVRRTEVVRAVRRRAGQVGPQAARVRDREVGARTSSRIASVTMLPLERLAEPAVDPGAGVRPRNAPVGATDLAGQDRRAARCSARRSGLDGRVWRDADRSTACGSRTSRRRRRALAGR